MEVKVASFSSVAGMWTLGIACTGLSAPKLATSAAETRKLNPHIIVQTRFSGTKQSAMRHEHDFPRDVIIVIVIVIIIIVVFISIINGRN